MNHGAAAHKDEMALKFLRMNEHDCMKRRVDYEMESVELRGYGTTSTIKVAEVCM